ncbi:hypothetical protein RJ639_017650 [Escallonia herrerae]|uniref:Integrase catalytic domain-containing protein n=1 Tax=Escallonia herrerae TaxID=1293975 RepID=A0AA88VDP2_9ASTE|nr:hypothetical protein RJ639_017650 [Escallonia herrerae]
MDILGPFLMATGQRHFVIVAIDYFTKWTGAEPLATITASKCKEFFWKNIVCRFGVPKVLIIDNEKQFDNSNFRRFCEGLSIDLLFTLVAHPQSNGQTENMNHSILHGLKRKLDDAKDAWVDELPKFSEAENEASLQGNLDLLDDVRAQALGRMISTKQRVAGHYNRRVRMRIFRVGDLVLRKLEVSDPKALIGKLSPNWEGPYKVTKLSKQIRILHLKVFDLLVKFVSLAFGRSLISLSVAGHVHREPVLHLAAIASYHDFVVHLPLASDSTYFKQRDLDLTVNVVDMYALP